MHYLRQSTALKVKLGPLVDATDGATAETAIALAAGEADLYKHDSAAQVDVSGNTWAHIAGGVYNLTLTTSNTDTVGQLDIIIRDAAARPFRLECEVLPAHVYDALVAGSDLFRADVREINDNSTAAANLDRSARAIVTGTVQTGSTVTSVATDLTEATNDHYNGRSIVFVTGTLAGQGATISDYSGATKALTVSALTEAPANGDSFVIV